jgi:hypothetical protein
LGQTVGSDQIGVLPRELIGVDYTAAVRDDFHLVCKVLSVIRYSDGFEFRIEAFL